MPFPKVPLNDGTEMPAIAFGSGTAFYQREATEGVLRALESGFVHIDTAQAYKNEESVGEAIKKSNLSRHDIYVTTKYGGGDIQTEIRTSLAKLGLKQVDLYLIHKPYMVEPKFEAAWKELEKIVDDGLARSIGVSSFDVAQLKAISENARIKPSVNQIRFSPYNYTENKALLEYHAVHGIVTEAYSSLSPLTKYPGGPVDIPVAAAAKRLGVTPAQVIFLWVISKGAVIVTTTSTEERLLQYLAVADLPPLTEEEILAIDEAGAGGPPLAS